MRPNRGTPEAEQQQAPMRRREPAPRGPEAMRGGGPRAGLWSEEEITSRGMAASGRRSRAFDKGAPPASRGLFLKRPCTGRVDAPRPARRPAEAYPPRYGEGGQRSRGGCSGPRMPGSEGLDLWRPASQGPGKQAKRPALQRGASPRRTTQGTGILPLGGDTPQRTTRNRNVSPRGTRRGTALRSRGEKGVLRNVPVLRFPGGFEGVLLHLVGDLAGGPAENFRRPRDYPPRRLERFAELLLFHGSEMVRPGG
jgi:hypothetical protein